MMGSTSISISACSSNKIKRKLFEDDEMAKCLSPKFDIDMDGDDNPMPTILRRKRAKLQPPDEDCSNFVEICSETDPFEEYYDERDEDDENNQGEGEDPLLISVKPEAVAKAMLVQSSNRSMTTAPREHFACVAVATPISTIPTADLGSKGGSGSNGGGGIVFCDVKKHLGIQESVLCSLQLSSPFPPPAPPPPPPVLITKPASKSGNVLFCDVKKLLGMQFGESSHVSVQLLPLPPSLSTSKLGSSVDECAKLAPAQVYSQRCSAGRDQDGMCINGETEKEIEVVTLDSSPSTHEQEDEEENDWIPPSITNSFSTSDQSINVDGEADVSSSQDESGKDSEIYPHRQNGKDKGAGVEIRDDQELCVFIGGRKMEMEIPPQLEQPKVETDGSNKQEVEDLGLDPEVGKDCSSPLNGIDLGPEVGKDCTSALNGLCDTCDCTIQDESQENLEDHIQCQCPVCGNQFMNRDDLKNHTEVGCLIPPPPPDEEEKKDSSLSLISPMEVETQIAHVSVSDSELEANLMDEGEVGGCSGRDGEHNGGQESDPDCSTNVKLTQELNINCDSSHSEDDQDLSALKKHEPLLMMLPPTSRPKRAAALARPTISASSTSVTTVTSAEKSSPPPPKIKGDKDNVAIKKKSETFSSNAIKVSKFGCNFMLNVKNPKISFPCHICPRKFNEEWMLGNHLIDQHCKVDSYDCDKCLSSFKRPMELHRHIIANHRSLHEPRVRRTGPYW